MKAGRSVLAMTVLFGLAACGGNPMRVYTAPAPAGALDCALRQTTNTGWQPIQGGVADGYIKFARASDWTGAAAGREAAARVMTMGLKGANRTVTDHLTVTGAGDQLRVQLVGIDRDGKPSAPSAPAEQEAEAVIAACAA